MTSMTFVAQGCGDEVGTAASTYAVSEGAKAPDVPHGKFDRIQYPRTRPPPGLMSATFLPNETI